MTQNRAAIINKNTEFKSKREDRRALREKQAEDKRHNKFEEGLGVAGTVIKGVEAAGKTVGSILGASKGGNPIEYYTKIAGTKGIAKVPSLKMGGTTYLTRLYQSAAGVVDARWRRPNLEVLTTHLTIGETTRELGVPYATSPRGLVSALKNGSISNVQQQFFTILREKNGGSLNAVDSQDMMEALFVFSSGRALLATLKRFYKIVWTYKHIDKSLAITLLAGIYGLPGNYSPREFLDYWSEHILELCTVINLTVNKVNCYPVPKSFSYCARHKELFSKIYIDDTSEFPAMYAHKLGGFFLWLDEPEEIVGDGTVGTDYMVAGYREITTDDFSTIAKLKSMVNEYFSYLQTSGDINLIASYIFNAYKVGGDYPDLMFEDILPEEELFTVKDLFESNYQVLMQMKHATVASLAAGTIGTSNYATQLAIVERVSDGALWQNKRCYKTSASASQNTVAIVDACMVGNDFHELSEEDVLEFTRLCTTYMVVTAGGATSNEQFRYIRSCGSEIVTRIDFPVLDEDESMYYSDQLGYTSSRSASFWPMYLDVAPRAGVITRFKYFTIQCGEGFSDSPNPPAQTVAFAREYPTYWVILKDSALSDIHEVAFYSEVMLINPDKGGANYSKR